MIYILTGTDQIKRQKEIEKIRKAEGGESAFLVMTHLFEEGNLDVYDELFSMRDLFGKSNFIRIKNWNNDEGLVSKIKEYADFFVKEKNILILETDSFTKTIEKKLQKLEPRVVTIGDAFVKKESTTLFALTDACLTRDKKRAWTLFFDAKKRGVSPEEIHGLMWWQYKTLALVYKTPKKEWSSLGVSPFVLKKIESSLLKYKKEDLASIINEFFSLVYSARQRSQDSYNALELFILEKI